MPLPTENYSEKFLKRLAGRTDLEDALKKLDRLTHEEAFMAIAQNYKAIQNVDGRVKGIAGSQLLQNLRGWLSPSDPSTNHNIACGSRHEGTAEWFFKGSIFIEWKTTGSLLWVHGKRTSMLPFQYYVLAN